MAIAEIVTPPHPFYPLEANIVGYLANEWSVVALLGSFAVACVVLLGGTLVLLRQYNPRLPGTEKATVLWFVLRYFSYNHAKMPGKQNVLGQMWKEYAFSDSRYLTSDPFVLCMETVTAFCWGPLSYVVASLIIREHPLRHPLQAMVSHGQLYGLVLYYATSLFDHYHKGLTYYRPEPYYFWCYFFFLNFIWMVIPGILLYSSIARTVEAFRAQTSTAARGSGYLKKSS